MWAHSKNTIGARHRLEDHLRGVAELARTFATAFGIDDLAWWTGLVHDGGKAWCAWQDKLITVEPTGGRVGLDHKSFGVQLARRHGLRPVEWAVAGHHGGLTCSGKIDELFGESDEHEARLRHGPWADAERKLRETVPEMFSQVPGLPAEFTNRGSMAAEFLLRFLFSCLVDADVLDTQAHREARSPRVGPDLDAPELLDRFLRRREAYLRERLPGPMDDQRQRVFEAALTAADLPPGMFRLTAPTGTAKTIAAGGFALRHAARYGKRRVIVAVPFITITEQNAAVYRELLDPDEPNSDPVVLEHHSHVEISDPQPGDRSHSWQRAAAENWDAPFIVTTTVQLFESLFGRTGSRMRKLHRIADSVIVLDEVQALPHRLLPQIADALRILTERFGVTVLLSSATQPALWDLTPFSGLAAVEVVPEPESFFTGCERVRFEWLMEPKPTLAEVVERATSRRRALMVVNTVRDARTAYTAARAVADGGVAVRHLSTGMCPAHRRRVLTEVRELLKADAPVFLASTSLIEAGVDVDFPVAFRAIGPPESMAQVAGRCNREGVLGVRGGQVVIFDPEDGGMPPAYQIQIEKARAYFGDGKADPEDLKALAAYFPDLYQALGIEDPGGVARTIARHRRRWDFQAVADGPFKRGDTGQRDRKLAFRMIVEDTVPVVVPYAEPGAGQTIARALDRLRGPEPDMTALRQLQPYMITLRRHTAEQSDVAPLLEPVVGDLREWRGSYDDGYGIVLEPDGEDFLL